MTPQEQKFIDECEWTVDVLTDACPGWPAGPKAVLIDALTAQLKSLKGEPPGVHTERDGKMGMILGLTFADVMHLLNGGTLKVNPKDAGLADIPITIFLGGTDEHMAEGLKKHPDIKGKFFDSHGEQQN